LPIDNAPSVNPALLRMACHVGQLGAWWIDLPDMKLTWSDEVYAIFEMTPGFRPMVEKAIEQFAPEHQEAIRAAVDACVRDGIGYDLELEIVTMSGRRRWTRSIGEAVRDVDGQIVRVQGAFQDITDAKQIQEELARSNEDLQQFAYVASHDLQEPLRAIAGCVQLLARRYEGRLDEGADELITHIVQGVERMQSLTNDILDFARINTKNKKFESVDIAHVLQVAIANLEDSLLSSGAVITHDELPRVHADSRQLASVFQNLLGNAIKFRRQVPPRIHLFVQRDVGQWRFALKDNGIGIERDYFDRIFVIFQRLHTRTEFPGTGIGLAVCKKIIQRHGGRIWIESEPGKGSTFFFTIPDRQEKPYGSA
jgi:light-regulated signal transduction histidine kinase (bacteriophytochrome)